ncbi:MAG TPA: bacteriocin [Rhodopila sp.]|nr:bacteriocin [Rhodopila sp.]
MIRELTDAELEQVSGGQTGGGVITAFTVQNKGLNSPVFNAFPGLSIANTQPGPNPPGHGQVTAAAAQSG